MITSGTICCQHTLAPCSGPCHRTLPSALDYDIEHCRDRDATQKAKLSNRLQWHNSRRVLAQNYSGSPSITQARPALPRLAQHYPGSPSITQARPALPRLAQHYPGSLSITQARPALPRLAQHYPCEIQCKIGLSQDSVPSSHIYTPIGKCGTSALDMYVTFELPFNSGLSLDCIFIQDIHARYLHLKQRNAIAELDGQNGERGQKHRHGQPQAAQDLRCGVRRQNRRTRAKTSTQMIVAQHPIEHTVLNGVRYEHVRFLADTIKKATTIGNRLSICRSIYLFALLHLQHILSLFLLAYPLTCPLFCALRMKHILHLRHCGAPTQVMKRYMYFALGRALSPCIKCTALGWRITRAP
ncbi:hypothetical protein BC936DRAFT_144085 [Jimgerdemannia flammicorona]|uniref:Uncharacterized protein n=1 Tax=Jimgerdemannia flammicorona TaxID=994334 RepID=A0A433DD01_9FUNG|nr:hypothetical protein BC936DRAFT_144085 [Jimgerdemannia flammicorona]